VVVDPEIILSQVQEQEISLTNTCILLRTDCRMCLRLRDI